MRTLLAWAVLGLTSLAVVLDTVFTAAHRQLLSEATWADHGWPLAPLASVGCALMGALIVSRYPRHPLGWLLSVASLLSVTLAAEAYSTWVLEGDGPGTAHGAHVVAWLAPLLGWPAFVALVMVFLIAPDGQFVSARWRWAAWATGAGLALHTVGSLLSPPGEFLYGQQYHGDSAATVLFTVGYLLVAAGLIASAASLVVRLRRSRDDVRRQLLWIASSAVFLAIGVVVILAVPRIQGVEGTWLAGLPLRLAQLMVPICVAVAVLRHRLLQIEVIINRALVLALATVAVAVGYVVVVVATGMLVRGGTTEFWPSLLATAVVAIAFQPVRRRVIRAADRLAFGASATPYEALADFSRRLGDRPDPAALLPAMAEAVARAVSARQCAVHLRLGHGSEESARWPQQSVDRPTDSHTDVPVVHGGQRLGSLLVAMPPGRPLRPREHRLLSDLADQAGLAFLNARLAAELSSKVELLQEHTDELDRSRRRLIDTSEAEHRRLEQAIASQVVPHLASLPDRLRTLSPFDAHRSKTVAVELAPLTASVASALEALREITRGVFPAQLTRAGLPTALRSLLARPHTAGELLVTLDDEGRRFDERVEAAAYFCVAQLADELDPPVHVHLSVRADQLSVVLTGNGPLPEPRSAHMVDRVEAVGGSMAWTTASGRTTVTVVIPLVEGSTAPLGGVTVLSGA